jgi:serine/threonine-protein kinase
LPRPQQIGPFEILGKPLGSGGMATVFRVRSPDGRIHALKRLHEHLGRDRQAVDRFKQEFNIGCQMKAHPAFVKMEACEKFDGSWCIVMEFVDGITLHDVLARRLLNPAQALALCSSLAEDLKPFHAARFVHRDLKPENLMILPDGKVKIMDYGVAREDGNRFTQTGTTVGTPLFMAPEQLLGSKSVDGRADIYSVGLILYRCLAKRDAHGMNAQTPYMELVKARQTRDLKDFPGLKDEALLALVRRCLAAEPGQRFATSNELALAARRHPEHPQHAAECLRQMLQETPEKPRATRKKEAPAAKTEIAPGSLPPGASSPLPMFWLLAALAFAALIVFCLICGGPMEAIQSLRDLF